jgi:hypothetical protein
MSMEVMGEQSATAADALAQNYLRQSRPIQCTGVHPKPRRPVLALTMRLHRETSAEPDEEAATARMNYPASWEPGGEDFFSPALIEADLMRRVLKPAEFAQWFHRFLPDVSNVEPRSILDPAVVSDRTDPKLVHLDGLNLSRAWCMRSIAAALPQDDPAREILARSAVQHAQDALVHVASGNYEGEHWLASFAVFLFSSPAP